MLLSNGTLLSDKSGSIKKRTQTIDNYVLWGVPEVCGATVFSYVRGDHECVNDDDDDDDEDDDELKVPLPNADTETNFQNHPHP